MGKQYIPPLLSSVQEGGKINFFSHRTAAERYAKFRPYFHPIVMDRIRLHLKLIGRVERALDVGCGTGMSTIALKIFAVSVTGVDISDEMLKFAPREEGIEYLNASAEDLSIFSDNSFDIITTSLAFHWFDQKRFLSEAYRLLKKDGWLIPYTNGFYGIMKGNENYEKWNSNSYAARYPSPPRNTTSLTAELGLDFGFSDYDMEKFQNEVNFTPEELSGYLTTQSNIISAVEQGTETIDQVYDWLYGNIKPFFSSEKAAFIFGGSIWYFRKK